VTGYAAYADIQCGDRDNLVVTYAALVKKIAYHLIARLPASVDVEDLIQAGMIGLLEAASHFKNDKGASFETFASIRIRGAMIDQLRQDGWAPRSVSRQLREMSNAIQRVEHRLGREANSREVAGEMGIAIDDYFTILQDSSSVHLCSLEQVSNDAGEILVPTSGDKPGEGETLSAVLADDFQRDLSRQIDQLPDKEKLVLALYYDSGLNLKEIGEVLEVSESRACQIHGQAIVRLKSRMSAWTTP
jgi:RNA polymerase sigma factor for flagellar operon FliA